MADDFLINATGSGDIELIPAPVVPGQFIRVMHYHLTSDATSVVTFKSNSTTKDIVYSGVAGGVSTPEFTGGIFDCAINEALVINASTGNVGGAGKFTIKGPPSGPNPHS